MQKIVQLEDFNTLFAKYHKSFVQFANTYVRDQFVAEDITLDAFTTFWQKKNDLMGNSNFPAYILTIIKNNCLNHLKRTRLKENIKEELKEFYEWELETRISTLEANNPEELFSKDIQIIVDRTLQELSPRTRTIYEMSRRQNKTHKEIAEELNISTKGVEFHISQAISVLRVALSDYLPLLILFSIKI